MVHDRHGTARGQLCAECRELLAYAEHRLERCPFQEGKTTCGTCQVHCYQPPMRRKMQAVMRTIGPTMFLRAPLMALRHLLDGLRRRPRKK